MMATPPSMRRAFRLEPVAGRSAGDNESSESTGKEKKRLETLCHVQQATLFKTNLLYNTWVG